MQSRTFTIFCFSVRANVKCSSTQGHVFLKKCNLFTPWCTSHSWDRMMTKKVSAHIGLPSTSQNSSWYVTLYVRRQQICSWWLSHLASNWVQPCLMHISWLAHAHKIVCKHVAGCQMGMEFGSPCLQWLAVAQMFYSDYYHFYLRRVWRSDAEYHQHGQSKTQRLTRNLHPKYSPAFVPCTAVRVHMAVMHCTTQSCTPGNHSKLCECNRDMKVPSMACPGILRSIDHCTASPPRLTWNREAIWVCSPILLCCSHSSASRCHYARLASTPSIHCNCKPKVINISCVHSLWLNRKHDSLRCPSASKHGNANHDCAHNSE